MTNKTKKSKVKKDPTSKFNKAKYYIYSTYKIHISECHMNVKTKNKLT